jgi:hypothetical protein
MGILSSTGGGKKRSNSLFSSTTRKTKSKSGKSSLFSKATAPKKSTIAKTKKTKTKKTKSNKAVERLMTDVRKKVYPKVKAAGQRIKTRAAPLIEKAKVKTKEGLEQGKSKGKDLVARGSAYLKSKFNKKPLKGEPNKNNVLEKDKKPDMLKVRADRYRKELKIEKKEDKKYQTETFEV